MDITKAQFGRVRDTFTLALEAPMRRLACFIPFIIVLAAGCEVAGPLDSAPAAPAKTASEGILIGPGTASAHDGGSQSTEQPSGPAETAAVGIMMGSGTFYVRSDSAQSPAASAAQNGGIMIGSGT